MAHKKQNLSHDIKASAPFESFNLSGSFGGCGWGDGSKPSLGITPRQVPQKHKEVVPARQAVLGQGMLPS